MPISKWIITIIDRAENKPDHLFLFDGIGALLSAFLLGVVLVKFEFLFGIPERSLYFLASLPVFFALYDFVGYLQNADLSGKLLPGIAILNMMYCLISLGVALYHFDTITLLGWIYIIIEISIVAMLGIIEAKVAGRLKHKRKSGIGQQ